ncbi:hypothetical protein RN001_012683 [Aquatica leii]|uniref:Uncharacterized protein n=1 Tax=Aquatica leii TaxID=1421715 RepID=A0AAN7P7S8_9COLE|nr:hypothetical protein RN001_012683 [Aquatica leii]
MSDVDDEMVAISAAIIVDALIPKRRKKRFWVRPSLRSRSRYSGSGLIKDLILDDVDDLKLEYSENIPIGDEKDKIAFSEEKSNDDEDRIVFPDEYENKIEETSMKPSRNAQARNVVSVGLKEGYDRDAKGRPVKEW